MRLNKTSKRLNKALNMRLNKTNKRLNKALSLAGVVWLPIGV
jgi:hypothetical protein